MKKYYVLFSAIIFTGSLLAQNIKAANNSGLKTGSQIETVYGSQVKKKAPGDVIWIENFDNGISGNSVDGIGMPVGGAWSRGAHNLDAIPDEEWTAVDFSSKWIDDVAGSRAGDPTALDWGAGEEFQMMDPALTGTDSGAPWMLFDVTYESYQDPNISADGYLNANGYLESPDINLDTYIDLGGTASVGVQFEQDYATCCAQEGDFNGVIQVGYYDYALSDYVWEDISIFSDITNTRYIETPSFTIADIFENAKAEKDAGNSAIIRIRFNWNPEGIYFTNYYWWMIDDVKLVEIEPYNSEQLELFVGDIITSFDYYAIPESQNIPIIMSSIVKNIGGSEMTNVRLEITITDPDGNMSSSISNGISLGARMMDTLLHYTTYLPPVLGEYTVTSKLLSNETNTSLNTELTTTFALTEFEYGQYNPNKVDADFELVDNSKIFMLYDIKYDTTIYGVSLLLISNWGGSYPNQSFFVNFYSGGTLGNLVDPDLLNPLSSTKIVLCDDYYSWIVNSIPFEVDIDLKVNAGDYLWVSFESIESIYDDISIAVNDGKVTDNGLKYSNTDKSFSPFFDANINLYFNEYYDYWRCYSSVDENNKSNLILYQNQPNPAEYNTIITYSIKQTTEVVFELRNIAGILITTERYGSQYAGEHQVELNTSELSNGIYFYTLKAGNEALTQKMVVTH